MPNSESIIEKDELVSTQTLHAKELSFKTVTVFEDRAEIHRVAHVILDQGLNRIEIEDFPRDLDIDTVRVDGHGPATIHEVQFSDTKKKENAEESDEVKELKSRIKELEEKKSKINIMLSTYVKHLSALDSLTSNIGKFAIAHEKEPKNFDAEAEASVEKLLEYHEKKSVEIGFNGWKYEREIKAIDKELSVLNTQIFEKTSKIPTGKSIIILLETTHLEADVKLDITYQTKNAVWKPSYDFRVQTNAKNQEQTLKLIYYGKIQQATNEDWKDTELILSTGQPKNAGTLPRISQLNARFKNTIKRPPPPGSLFGKQHVAHSLFGAKPSGGSCQSFSFGVTSSTSGGLFGAAPPTQQQEGPPRPITPPQLEVVECTTENTPISTTFVIPMKKTIPSDMIEHKVTIATLDLSATFRYECVPKKNPHVFLTADVTNDSVYPLLPGSVSVYINNSFSMKSSISKRVACGEKLQCSLGVDPSIHVEYKPVKRKTEKLFDVVTSIVHDQGIVVKNSKKEAILLTLYEAIPKSNEENIKVKVIHPEIPIEADTQQAKEEAEDFKVGAKLNKLNNLVWIVQLAPEEEKEPTIKWSIDYPNREAVEFYETL